MSNQEINELNALQVLEYDIFGKCNDMMSFIKNSPSIQRDDPQIKIKIGAVAKLINQLIKILKDYDSSMLQAQPEYYDIVYIINNNLSLRIKQYEENIKQMTVNDNLSKNEIVLLKQEIKKITEDHKEKVNLIDNLIKEKEALTHQFQFIKNQDEENISIMEDEQNELNRLKDQLTNEVNQLKMQLKQREDKIQNQEGKINQLMQQVKKIQNDKSQDRKHDLFYEQQQILDQNLELTEIIKKLALEIALTQTETDEQKEIPQEEKELNLKKTEQAEEIQNKIFGLLNKLSFFGILLSAYIGAYVVIQNWE